MQINKAIKFGDNIDTDQIIGAHHLVIPTIMEMAGFTFENHHNFRENFSPSDFIVGGANFGCGSSREQAPAVLKEKGISGIIAKSFARIFYRNSINLGIALYECDMAGCIEEGDILESTEEGYINNLSKKEKYKTRPLPPFIKEIINHGGIIQSLNKME